MQFYAVFGVRMYWGISLSQPSYYCGRQILKPTGVNETWTIIVVIAHYTFISFFINITL